ncbi:hypothetical protein Syun_009998 [Stephania yunnanensis]|uniref:Uncharacterized protein n=1 Tax=Stephania yunnanensis TaxID=152371 RepID=A0AAP0PR79_9MAGN
MICYHLFSEYEYNARNNRNMIHSEDNAIVSSPYILCASSTGINSVNIIRFDDVFTQCLQSTSFDESCKSELDLYF